MFMRMMKVDAKTRRVYAELDETPDGAGEALDYATSKPHFQTWSERLQKASGGKNLGNVRIMHSLREAGVVETLDFDDERRAIGVGIHVVDDDAWRKVEAGVFTGISPGGIAKRFRDAQGQRRYTGMPSEISLVDLPCNPNATFTMVKADGSEDVRHFAPRASGVGVAAASAAETESAPTEGEIADVAAQLGAIREPDDYRAFVIAQPARMLKTLFPDPEMMGVELPADMTKRDFSDAARKQMAKEGKAMPDGSFPIENKTDLENAIQAHGRAKDKDAVKKHIVARAKVLKLTDELPEDFEGSTKMSKSKLGDFMRKKMEEKKLTIADLAEAAGVSDGTMDSILNGKIARPPDARLSKLAEKLGVKTDTLIALAPSDRRDPEPVVQGKSPMKKGLGDVAQFTQLIQSLTWLASCVTADAAAERDGSSLPAELAAWVKGGVELLMKLASEETAEAMTALEAGVAAITAAAMAKVHPRESGDLGALAKAGARHSKEDLARVQLMHDTAVDLGAQCAGDGMAKAAAVGALATDLAAITTRLRAIEAENVELKKFKDAPRGGGPAVRAVPVERTQDGATAKVPDDVEKMPPGQEKTVALIKHAMQHPEAPKAPRAI